jgi:hypothetical protein
LGLAVYALYVRGHRSSHLALLIRPMYNRDTDTDTDRVPSHTPGRDRHEMTRYLYLYLYNHERPCHYGAVVHTAYLRLAGCGSRVLRPGGGGSKLPEFEIVETLIFSCKTAILMLHIASSNWTRRPGGLILRKDTAGRTRGKRGCLRVAASYVSLNTVTPGIGVLWA